MPRRAHWGDRALRSPLRGAPRRAARAARGVRPRVRMGIGCGRASRRTPYRDRARAADGDHAHARRTAHAGDDGDRSGAAGVRAGGARVGCPAPRSRTLEGLGRGRRRLRAVPGLGPAKPHHAPVVDLFTFGRARGRADDLPARGDRRRAQLGLPVRVGSRRESGNRSVPGHGSRAGGARLFHVVVACEPARSPTTPTSSEHISWTATDSWSMPRRGCTMPATDSTGRRGE